MVLGASFLLRAVFVHDFVRAFCYKLIALAANSWLANSLFIYTAENFLTGRRSGASGAVQTMANLIAMSVLFVSFYQQLGFFNAMAIISCFCFAVALVILKFSNKTVGRSLEEVNRYS